MDEYKKYLADRLLSEEQPKPDSIHATYLVYGIKPSENGEGDGDVEMSSSMPEHGPISEEIPASTLTLVREENLKGVLTGYQEVTSIHIYSLAPHPQRDLSLLSDVSKALSEYASQEPDLRKFGAITNPHVRRRDRQGRPKPVAPNSSKPVKPQPSSIKREPPPATQPKPAPAPVKAKEESAATPVSKESTPSSISAKPTPSLKRGGSGGIMQSFAKAAQKPAKPKQEPKKEEEVSMALSDDGEADDDDIVPSKKPGKDTDSARKTRKEREEQLRRMMEEDDDDEEDEPEEREDDEEMEEAPEPEPEPEPETKEDKEPSEVVSAAENGRRRGKRRIMKKKRILDDQGYMVTIQEPGWESFSEDEAPPPAKKPTPAATPSSSGAKPKKPATKGGQGNIMSFFSKK
ncbi:CDC27 protein [Amphichorda felina]